MSRSSQQGALRGARVLGLLALLLGLLAMHGLGSGHQTGGGTAARVEAVVPAGHQHAGSAHRHLISTSGDVRHQLPALNEPTLVAVDPLGTSAALEPAPCDGCQQHDVALLCLAVLTLGLAGLVGLLAQHPHPSGAVALPEQPTTRAGPPLRLRPPDLVAGLCVSRT